MSKDRPVNPWVALAALCVGFFMIMLDTTIVNVAIPSMIRGLHTGLNQVNWVNSVYLLTYAAPLLLSGRLGDHLGRKPVFLAGMAIFTVASLWCGLAGSAGTLIAARAVQGLGAAAMVPQSMAFITHLFPPERRGAPLGVWGGMAALAAASGPLIGGLLVDNFGWQWIFLVNVGIGVLGLALVSVLVPGGQPRHHRRFDVLGTVLSGGGLLAVVFGLQNGQEYHWGAVVGPVTIAAVIAVGVTLLVAFVIWQRFNASEPLVPLALFEHRNFSVASIGVLCVGFALTGMYLPLTIFVQTVLGLSPLMAGLTTVPSAIGAGIAAPIVGRLSDRIGGKPIVIAGFGLYATGLTLIAVLTGPDTSPWTLRAVLLVCGLGAGSAFAPLASVATGDVGLPMMGAASGVYNTFRQVGSVVGSAAVGVLLQDMMAARHAALSGATLHNAGLASAVRVTMLLPAGVLVLGLLVSCAMVRRGRAATPSAAAGGRRGTKQPLSPLAR